MSEFIESSGKYAGLRDSYERDIIILAAIAMLERWKQANQFLNRREE